MAANPDRGNKWGNKASKTGSSGDAFTYEKLNHIRFPPAQKALEKQRSRAFLLSADVRAFLQ
jgi:hypothetical protein